MLPRRHRLTTPDDYRAVMRGRAASDDGRRRRRAGTDLLVVHAAVPAAPTEDEAARLLAPCSRAGFVVSRAVGNSVTRHRVVRRLRVLVGQRLHRLPVGSDLVVRALPSSADASSLQLGQALDAALERLLAARR